MGMPVRASFVGSFMRPLDLSSSFGRICLRTLYQRTRRLIIATILYARVSTADQTLEHQVTQAEEAGFTIDTVIADHGVSGVSTRLRERPEGRRLFDMLRAGDTLVVRWVDRLGRNYDDVTEVMRSFLAKGVRIETVISRMTFDGTTRDPIQRAVRDALISFMAATAEATAEVQREAQRAGIAKAKSAGAYRGRKPSFDRETFDVVQQMLSKGSGATEIARTSGLSRQTVLRIKARPEHAEKLLVDWGM